MPARTNRVHVQTAGARAPRVTRLPHRLSVLGVRIGHIVAWQLTAFAAVLALAAHGPLRWALAAVTAFGCALTLPRWRHRWAYEWLATAWRFHHGPRSALPRADIIPARVRRETEAAVIHDGDGFAVILAVEPEADGPPVIDLPLARLTGLLDPDDTTVSAVQVVLHADLAAGPAGGGPAAAYRGLGYHQVPRSASAWLALRHDPAESGYAVGGPGSARDVQASLVRGLATRGTRTRDLIGDLSLRTSLVDPDTAWELLGPAGLADGDPVAASAGRSRRWGAWHSQAGQHLTYWLRRWPPGGIPALQQALMTVPAASVTTAVLARRGDGGQLTLTTTVRVTADPARPGLRRAVTAAAAACGGRLVRLDGEHGAGIAATLPLGRGPAGWRLRQHADGGPAARPSTRLPVTAGGLVIGADARDSLVFLPCFAAAGPARLTVIGDPLLPRLMALRALGAGARVLVVTAQPGGWARLRELAQVPPERLGIARPGTQPPGAASRSAPWLVIDDTGGPGPAGGRPWQAMMTALGPAAITQAVLAGQDTLLLERSSAEGAAAVVTALGLTGAAGQALQRLPDGVVAVARPGAGVSYARLAPDQAERATLAGSLPAAG